MILNPGKCHYSIIDRDITNEFIKLGKKTLHAEDEQTFLSIITDKDLNFQSHTKSIKKKANQELIVLIRVTPFMADFHNVIFNLFIKEQFSYFPLNHKIYRLDKIGLRALLHDETSTLMTCYQKVTILSM